MSSSADDQSKSSDANNNNNNNKEKKPSSQQQQDNKVNKPYTPNTVKFSKPLKKSPETKTTVKSDNTQTPIVNKEQQQQNTTTTTTTTTAANNDKKHAKKEFKPKVPKQPKAPKESKEQTDQSDSPPPKVTILQRPQTPMDTNNQSTVNNNTVGQQPKEVKQKQPKAPKEPRAPREPKTPKVPKEPTQPKEPKVPREPKAPKVPKEPKQPKEPKEPMQPNEPKEPKVPKQPKEPKIPKEPKEPKEPKQPKLPKAPKEPKEPKISNEPKAPRDQKVPKHPKELKAPKEPKEPKQPKLPKSPKQPVPHQENVQNSNNINNNNNQPKGDKKDKRDRKDKKEGGEKQEKKPRERKEKKEPSKDNTETGQEVEKKKKKRNKYEVHVTIEQVQEGLISGKYFYGQLRVNAKKYMDAYITTDGVNGDVYCDGIKNRNRGINTDIVVFELVKESEWKKRPGTQDEGDDQEDQAASLKDATADKLDQGTIAIPFTSPSIAREKFRVEKELNDDDEDSNSDTDDDEEIVLNQNLSELNIKDENNQTSTTTITTITTTITTNTPSSEDEDIKDFVVVNKDETNSPITTTTSTKPKKINETKGLKQQIEKLQQLVDKALNDGFYVTVKVVHVLEVKHSNNHVGIISEEFTNDSPNNPFATFTPLDTALPRCLVFRETIPEYRAKPEKYKTLLVSVNYGKWSESSQFPVGRFHSIFGEAGEIEPETRALLKEYNVDTDPFSKEVMQCLPNIKDAKSWKPSKEDIAQRRDLRDWVIVSIDPDTAKDLDDALSCVELPDGNFEVGVHIADVSHFVQPDTALDDNAKEKATTVYLVQKAIPMLPSLLSEELCSLNYGVERFAFSVVWKVTPDGTILEEWFGKSVIKSACRLTYATAQKIIDGKIKNSWNDGLEESAIKPILGPNDPQHIHRVVKSVMGLREIARKLRKERIDNGAFTIHPTKLAFSLDEKGNPVSTKIYPMYESNHLVEEFMLMANMQVAKRISSYFPTHSLLRRHPLPNQNKLQKFITFCASHGFNIDSTSVGSLGESITNLKNVVEDPSVFTAIQLLSVRSMKLAEYFSTGDIDEEEWGHYALNVQHYTHFTSPIRRYADIIVHRLLQLSIQVENANKKHSVDAAVAAQLPHGDELTMIAKQCNEKKMNARKAQERSDKVFLCVLLQNTPTYTEAVVLAGGRTFIQCIVPMFGCEQRIYLSDLKDVIVSESYVQDKDENTIIWPETPNDLQAAGKHIRQHIKQLSTIKVLITVDKSKFPIDLKCTLLHPNHDDFLKI